MAFPVIGNANQISYATNLASLLSQIWLWDPAWALSIEPEVYEKQCRDLTISGSLDHLQRAIVGHDYSFEPKTDDVPGRKLAGVIEDLTKEQRGFPQALYNLSRATHRGCAWARIYPERRVLTIGDGKPREWTVIAKVRDADKRRFRLVRALGTDQGVFTAGPKPDAEPKETDVVGAKNVLGDWKWEFHEAFMGKGSGGAGYYTPLERVAPFDQWILHVPDTTEWGVGYGYGLADELQAYFWMKGAFLRWAAQSAERFGQGFLAVKTKALRDLMAKGYSQAAAMTATINVIRTMRSENFVALDENSEVQLLDMPGEGMRWLYEWVKYLDNGMRQRILAALQPTGSSDGTGGYSSGKVEEDSTDSMVAYLRSPLEETWTHTGVHFLVEHNEANLRELGLWGIGDPRLRLKGKEQRDGELMLKWFDLAARLKIPVRKKDFYESSGLAAPNEEDGDVIDYPEAPVVGGGLDDVATPFGEVEREDAAPVGEGGTAVGDRSAA